MLVKRVSPMTSEVREIDLPITQEQYDAWLDGKHIQIAFPNLTSDQREFILTGLVKEEWDELFPDEDEDESSDITISER